MISLNWFTFPLLLIYFVGLSPRYKDKDKRTLQTINVIMTLKGEGVTAYQLTSKRGHRKREREVQ